MFEIFIRGHGGFEYLDLTAISAGGLLEPSNYDPTNPALPSMDDLQKQYKGEGYAVGGQAGVALFDALDLGADFRYADVGFDKSDGSLTQIAVFTAWHMIGSDLIFDPYITLGFGWCYLTTRIPEISGAAVTGYNEERTANGFIGRTGAGLDIRFVSWMSAGILADFSFLYFDASLEHTAWGFNTDVFARLSFHI